MKIDVSRDDFEERVLASPKPVLVDFWAEWCVPCNMMEPVLDEVASELDGQIIVGRVNVDAEEELADRYNVVSIPVFVLFRGGKVVAEHIGAAPKSKILAFIRERLG